MNLARRFRSKLSCGPFSGSRRSNHVYHMAPPEMAGEVLYPLNLLKGHYPEVYQKALEKYKGRESLLQEKVFPLDCLWNDVLHFCPIDPKIIFEEIKRLGILAPTSRRYFKIPATRLKNQRVTIYNPPIPTRESFEIRPEDFSDFNADVYQEVFELSFPAKEYYRKIKHEAARPLLFTCIPHILLLGELDIGGIEVLEWHQ